jgi:hypothetical protein
MPGTPGAPGEKSADYLKIGIEKVHTSISTPKGASHTMVLETYLGNGKSLYKWNSGFECNGDVNGYFEFSELSYVNLSGMGDSWGCDSTRSCWARVTGRNRGKLLINSSDIFPEGSNLLGAQMICVSDSTSD